MVVDCLVSRGLIALACMGDDRLHKTWKTVLQRTFCYFLRFSCSLALSLPVAAFRCRPVSLSSTAVVNHIVLATID